MKGEESNHHTVDVDEASSSPAIFVRYDNTIVRLNHTIVW